MARIQDVRGFASALLPSPWRRPRTGRISECSQRPLGKGVQPTQPAMVFGGAQLVGLLPVIDACERATVPPELKMPPPLLAVLPVTSLWFSLTGPPGRAFGPPSTRPLLIPPPLPPA